MTTAARRKKVLLSAYACEPNRGSEPGVGWQLAWHLAAHHEVTVLTRANNRAAIEEYFRTGPAVSLEFLYYDLPAPLLRFKQGPRWARAYYFLWQLGAYFFVRKVFSTQDFDLIHHITFAKYWTPSFLALLPRPFVLGPVGGGESAPFSFWWSCGVRGFLFELARAGARQLGEWDPFVRVMLRRARIVFAATPETAVRLKKLGARNIQLLSQVALPAKELAHIPRALPPRNQKLVLVSVGQLLHLKGFHLALQALASLREYDFEYRIIGSGPELQRLQMLARQFGLQDRVTFCGALPRATVLQELQRADMLLHPALHESGGWVVVEAMNAGCVPVCAELGGSVVLVNSYTGVLVPAHDPLQFVGEFSQAIEGLFMEPARLTRLAQAAQSEINQHFSWTQTADIVAQSYDAS